jgi:ATP-dependent DNA ligase
MIKTFPTLFKKKPKRTYTWEIGVTNEKSKVYIVTSHGAKNGKMVTHKKEIEKSKSKKTIKDQAMFEANSKWKSKQDKEGYSEDENTSNLVIRPMLAHTFKFDSLGKKGKHIVLPAYCQRKFDGIRCLGFMKDNNPDLMSRQGKQFVFFKEIKDDCRKMIKESKIPDLYLDGELYSDDIPFQEITGLARLSKKIPDKDKEKMKLMKLFIYDCFSPSNPDWAFDDRLIFLQKLFKKKYNNLILTETFDCNTQEDIKKYHTEFVKNGYEGVILRNIKAPYEIGKRSKHLQKYKEFIDDEFKIVGFKEGTGGAKGTVIWLCETNDGKPFSVRPKGTTAERKKFYKDGNKYIGKLLTVIFQEYTDDGIPRFPVGKAIRYIV